MQRDSQREAPIVVVRLAALVAACLVVAGCSETSSAPDADDAPLASAGAPDFTGPWAGAFATAWQNSATDLERDVLRDGDVDDLEVATLRNGLVSCLEGHGFTQVTVGDLGEISIDVPADMTDGDAVDAVVEQCDVENGLEARRLAFSIRQNPENLDMGAIVAACLVDAGVVDPGYSADDYYAESEAGAPSWPETDADATRCLTDPLGTLGR